MKKIIKLIKGLDRTSVFQDIWLYELYPRACHSLGIWQSFQYNNLTVKRQVTRSHVGSNTSAF
jgi:hypothetical protein